MEIKTLWETGVFKAPKVPLAIRNNYVYVVIDDDMNIYRLMDEYGNIYGISNTRCIKKNDETYQCQEQINQIVCRYLTDRDQFAFDYILPTVYTGDIYI